MDHGNFAHFDVTSPSHPHHELHASSGPDPADRSPLTPAHDPNFLEGLLPFYNPQEEPQDEPFAQSDHHLHAAYRRWPTPPAANFLDTILNPAGYDHNRFSPFYRVTPPLLRQSNAAADSMPPAAAASIYSASRPARLPNGYVDLTATPDSPPPRRTRPSPSPGPSAKRQKRDHGAAAQRTDVDAKIEEVDLTDEKKTVHDILRKQREDAVKSQTKPEEKPTTFSTFTCVICMDTPTDLTATACGHLFCHTCLMEALIAGENRSGAGEPKRSQCPVCRKFINKNKSSDVISLLLKKGLATQPRKKKDPVPPTSGVL